MAARGEKASSAVAGAEGGTMDSARVSKGYNRLDLSIVALSARKLRLAVSRTAALALLSGLLLVTVCPALAQTEAVLYNFPNVGSQGGPNNGLTFHAGSLFATTFGGGASGGGTVFKLSQLANGKVKETVLYNFVPGSGGFGPSSNVIFDSKGNLYGTTTSGGTGILSGGVAFELSFVSGTLTETTLYNFDGGPFGSPYAGLIMDKTGNLYGTTDAGPGSDGIVFELSPSGSGWNEQVIDNLSPPTLAGLAMDLAGNIFGVVHDYGDVNDSSNAFELTPNGNGGWNSKVIHYFTGSPDGDYATGTPVLDKAGNVYGTTASGGNRNNGIVYRLSPQQNGDWKEDILYSFQGGTKDGSTPYGGVVIDKAGNIFGTTYSGGRYGYGTVFVLVAGNGIYKEKVLWNFNGTDGANPYLGSLLDLEGKLFGTTLNGGSSGGGVAFEVTP